MTAQKAGGDRCSIKVPQVMAAAIKVALYANGIEFHVVAGCGDVINKGEMIDPPVLSARRDSNYSIGQLSRFGKLDESRCARIVGPA